MPGSRSREEFSRDLKADALRRSMDAKGFPRCQVCGLGVKAGGYAFDHINPDGLTGKPTLANCQVLCTACHVEKTRGDVARIAKAKRVEAKHIGLRSKQPNRLRGPGFRKREKIAWRSSSELSRLGDAP